MLKQRLFFRLDKLIRQDAFNMRNKIARQSCHDCITFMQRNYTKTPEEERFKITKTGQNGCGDVKFYSSYTRLTRKPLIEYQQGVKSLIYDEMDVLSFLDICINSDMTSLAYKSLCYYHENGSVKDICVYNCLLEAYAAEGNWNSFENVMKMISNGNVKPNLQTYIYAIECAYRADKNQLINTILNEIKSNGFDVNNLFIQCNLMGDQREVVLKAIRSQLADFEPTKRTLSQTYTNNLLQSLDKSLPNDEIYNPLGLHEDASNLKYLAEKEIEEQIRGYKRIPRVDHTPEFCKENEELIKKIKEYESKWIKEMLLMFQNKLNEYRKFHDESDGKICLFPYLSALKPEEVVDLMFQNFVSLTFVPVASDISILHEKLGFSVMDKYFLQNNIKSDTFKCTRKLYNEFCNYFVNPKLTSQFTGRQYWNFLKEKYSEELERSEIKWPQGVLTQIGEIMFSIMTKVIQIDWNFLENNTGSYQKQEILYMFYVLHILSPFVYNNREYNGIERIEIKTNFSARKYFGLVNAGEFKLNLGDFPMLSPPIPWTSMSFGGYILNHRFSDRAFLRVNEAKQEYHLRKSNVRNLFPYFDAANNLAESPWRINKKILDTLLEVFNNWDNPAMDGFTSYQTETNKQMTKLLFGVKQAKSFDTKVFHWLTKLSVANELRDSVFWFPHFIDFRGRSDADRGLLIFARGEPLGKDGLDWLKLQLISLTDGSRNKTSLKDRIEYCDELLPEIMDSADNPLKGNGWWKTSSKPWQTLACCIEITSAIRSPDPQSYVCHLPVHQDGYCNGLQHFAALGRDLETAREVNLAPNKTPKDLYSKITDNIEEMRKKDAAKGNRFARSLEGIVTRQFVKMPLLMMVYDINLEGTLFHVSDQLKDISTFPYDQRKLASQYFVDKLWTFFQAEFPKVNEIQNWISDCAKHISQTHSQPVKWVTPIGLPVVQQYYEIGKPFGKKTLYKAATKALNVQKQSSGFPANFIQSLDASHMVLTSLFCRRHGIAFVSIHDSFWSHPSRAAQMNKICREQFVALHSEPLLESLSQHSGLEEQSTLQEVLSKVPLKGSFDLKK
uniref:DNA-directed RNA polymerase n=1 Tax=Strigamia maritima TaxID=126957 RepID=T1IWM0_STRMM